MEVKSKNLHLYKFVLDNVPRMLSWIDRRQGSPTYGSSDRNYWHYKIVDFPCSMLQETALTLALLYTTKFNGNYFYGKNYIKKLALAQILYWKKIQNRNGSFDEFFPNEQSFSATAFTLYSSCKTLQILDEDPEFIRKNAKKSCEFLINYGDPGASNQISASIAAINLYSILFNDTSFDQQLNQQLNKLLESQSDEGWTPEYGGFDVGYQSITLAYLSDFNISRADDRVSKSILKMIEFMSYFIHPNGSVGGEYGSRNTTFIVPFGFAQNLSKCELASTIYKKLFFTDKKDINTSIDDRYICHFILPSYLLTIKLISENKIKVNLLPYEKLFSNVFKDSGLWIESRPGFYFICNTKKQGVFNIYGKEGQGVLSDLGYNIEKDSQLAVTNWINTSANIINNKSGTHIKGSFFLVSNKLPNSFYHFCLRLLSFSFKRRLLPILKKYFILREKPLNGFFERSIKVSDSSIVINDIIHYESKKKVDLSKNETSSFRYVAPTNYFQRNELSFYNSPIICNNIINHIQISQNIIAKNFEVKKTVNEI